MCIRSGVIILLRCRTAVCRSAHKESYAIEQPKLKITGGPLPQTVPRAHPCEVISPKRGNSLLLIPQAHDPCSGVFSDHQLIYHVCHTDLFTL